MADDDELGEGFVEEVDPDLEETFDEDAEDEEPEAEVLTDEPAAAAGETDDDADDEPAPPPPPKTRRKSREDDDEEDDDELDPDDVEADLDKILKDRIAAADDDDDEEEVEQPPPRSKGEQASGVTPKRANEFMCTGCFLLVNRAQFGPLEALECPVGEGDCPAIAAILEDADRR